MSQRKTLKNRGLAENIEKFKKLLYNCAWLTEKQQTSLAIDRLSKHLLTNHTEKVFWEVLANE